MTTGIQNTSYKKAAHNESVQFLYIALENFLQLQTWLILFINYPQVSICRLQEDVSSRNMLFKYQKIIKTKKKLSAYKNNNK